MHKRWMIPLVGLTVAGLTLVGCGDDGGDDVAAYCEAVAEIETQQGPPTVEQIDRIEDAAPEEIRDDVEFVAERFREAIEADDLESVFGDPEVGERLEPIEAFEKENCPELEGAEGDDEADPDAAQMTVTATEYVFEVDATMAAGPTAFTFVNAGEEDHEMFVVRLVEGATVDDALEAEQTGGDPDEFVDEEVGHVEAEPAEQAFLNADLAPGNYAMVCFIPAPDGEPHVAKGMVASFEVTGA